MIKCCTCKEFKEEEQYSKNNNRCKDCVKYFNRKYADNRGVKQKFIPIVTDTHKQCCKCKEVKELSNYSPTPRGQKGRAAYCKPCMSLYQLSKNTKEERRVKTQQYRDSNRDWWRSLHRLTQFKRRNTIHALSDGSVTKEFVESIYNIDTCYYCGINIPREFRTLEHALPLTKGGYHSISNIVMACVACNCSKADKTEEEYIEYKKWELKQELSQTA